jgi:hypothetical protein
MGSNDLKSGRKRKHFTLAVIDRFFRPALERSKTGTILTLLSMNGCEYCVFFLVFKQMLCHDIFIYFDIF